MIKILHITPDFNYSCGRSKLVFFYLKYFGNQKEYETHFITNGGDSLDRLQEISSLKFKQIKFSTGIKNILFYFKFYNELKNYIIENKINLIHTNHRFPELIANKIADEIKIKTVTSAHSFVNGFKKSSFKSDKIISVSKSISSFIIENYNINKEKVITLYNPVEKLPELNIVDKEKIKREMGINSNQKILMFVGRINYQKGYDKLIKAYEIVYKKDQNIILIMCGKVEEKSFWQMRTKLTVPIIVIPSLKNNKPLYEIADIIILSSRQDPFPFVMIEAGSHKKPFIGGNTGGIKEFIDDKVNGLLVNPENEDDLAEKILFIFNNKNLAEEFGRNLYKKVIENCDYENYFNKVDKIYKSLLNM
ncbi:MAG TPA: glycosyltransferase family 4 protein [Ignavibacteriaceae bacterium]|nr:glycosyltransferase family 4 protein [Ignavibacteriaceae bacterium]